MRARLGSCVFAFAFAIACLLAASACDRCGSTTPASDAALAPADAINASADAMNASADAMNASADAIDASADAIDASADAVGASAHASSCPAGMARVERAEGAFCIDRWEATVVVVGADGHERAWSPYQVVEGATFRAKTAPGVVPQAYISQLEAAKACKNAGKRLCAREEFERACRGPDDANLYPYGGADKQKGACNEGKGSSIPAKHGMDPAKWTYKDFNDPALNTWPGKLAKTGAFARCVSPYGVFDLVGNLHEWGDDPPDAKGRARFRGGWYGDAEVNGHGCAYVTRAHEPTYHDYSTGFRCCQDAAADERQR